MNLRKSNKQKNTQSQRFRLRYAIIAGFSIVAIATGIFIYLQISQTELTKAEVSSNLSSESLPVEMVVEQLVLSLPDTNNRNGARYKIAKQLTPIIIQ